MVALRGDGPDLTLGPKSILTKQQVRRGVDHDIPELIAAIEAFIGGYSERAQPFVWITTAEEAKATKSKSLQDRCARTPASRRDVLRHPREGQAEAGAT